MGTLDDRQEISIDHWASDTQYELDCTQGNSSQSWVRGVTLHIAKDRLHCVQTVRKRW